MKNIPSPRLRTLAIQILIISLTLLFISLKGFASDGADIRSKADIPANLSGKTVIIQTNDIHGQMWSYKKTAELKKELKERGANVILVDLGDYSSGTVDVSSTNGRSAIQAMNSAGYDLATIGNHEFDYGYGELKNNLASSSFTNICANIIGDNGKTLVQPNAMISGSGLSIGFFGLCTPQTPLQLDASFTQGLKFLSGEDLYACAQEQTDLLRRNGANLVICLSHLGQDSNLEPVNSSSIDLYANTRGINLILDSHSHTSITKGPGGEPIQAAGVFYEYVGIVIINNASHRIEDRFLISTADAPSQDTQSPSASDPSGQIPPVPAAPLNAAPLDAANPGSSEKTGGQDAAAQNATDKNAAPQDASSQNTAEKNSAPQDASLQNTAEKNSTTTDAASQGSAEKPEAPQDSAPQDASGPDTPQDAADN